MTTTLAEFHEKFRVPELEVVSSAHWTWSVRPVQTTLGAGILSLNRFADVVRGPLRARGRRPGRNRQHDRGNARELLGTWEDELPDAHDGGRPRALPCPSPVRRGPGRGRRRSGPTEPGRDPPVWATTPIVGGSGTLLAIRDSLRALDQSEPPQVQHRTPRTTSHRYVHRCDRTGTEQGPRHARSQPAPIGIPTLSLRGNHRSGDWVEGRPGDEQQPAHPPRSPGGHSEAGPSHAGGGAPDAPIPGATAPGL